MKKKLRVVHDFTLLNEECCFASSFLFGLHTLFQFIININSKLHVVLTHDITFWY